MFAERWIYDFLIYAYALSLVFAYADLFHPNRKSRRIAYLLLIFVWVLQTTIFTLRAFEFPLVTRFDSLFLYGWILITSALIMQWVYRMPIFVFFINLCGFTVLAINFFFVRDASPIYGQLLLSELVFVHLTMAVTAYAAFSMSSICAGLYLLNNYLLKKKRWNYFLMRLPSLDRLQVFAKWLVMIGTLLLVVAMILGTIYAYQMVGHHFWLDPKVWGSIAVLLIYGFVSYHWMASRWESRRVAWWNLLASLAIVLNYAISDLSFSFHHWT